MGMYNKGVLGLLESLSKSEITRIIDMYDSETVNTANILTKPFRVLTSDMNKVSRSNFKKKLLDSDVIGEFNKKIMLNPYIFMPRNDSLIKNNQYLVQQTWRYMFENEKYNDEIIKFAEHIFNYDFSHTDYMKVGSKNSEKIIKKPKK